MATENTTLRSEIARLFADEDYQDVASYRLPYTDRTVAPRLHIGYRDAAGDYAGVIVMPGVGVWAFHGVRPPAHLTQAVDCDRALRGAVISSVSMGGVGWDDDMPCEPPTEELQDWIFCLQGMNGDEIASPADTAASLIRVNMVRPFFD